MRVVAAFILALAAGASGCSCSSSETEEQCTTDCTGAPCVWQDPCDAPIRRNLRFGAAAPFCCVDICGPKTRRLTAEEIEERRRLHIHLDPCD